MNRDRTWLSLLSLTLALLLVAPMTVAAEDDSFDSDGVPIAYTDMGGDGEPVVLLHSFLSSSDMWTNAGFEPSDDFRFIALDLRGHGDSGKPEDPDDGLRCRRWSPHGSPGSTISATPVFSIGAEVALRLAAEHPERLRSLVVAGSGWSDPAKEGEIYAGVAMGLAASPTVRDMVMAGMPADMPQEQLDFLSGSMEAHGIDLDYEGTAGLAGVAGSMGDILGLTEADMASIDVPVLGVVSENDDERPNIERMEGVVPDFELVLVPAGPTGDPWLDHLGATTDPLFKSSIIEFLSAQA